MMPEKDKYLYLSLLSGIVGAILLFIMGHHPNDDAYITFRHSYNMAEHFRLAWNLKGHPELGSSSPLMAIVLGVMGFIAGGSFIPQIAFYFNILILICMGPVFYLVILTLTKDKIISLLSSLVICINSYNVRIYSQGFEAALFTFLFFLCLLLLYYKKYPLGYLLAGLLPLVRAEGVFIFALIACLAIYRKQLNKSMFLAFIFPAAWLLFSVLYYEQFLPQSIMAKKMFMKYQPLIVLLRSNPQNSSIDIGLTILQGTWDILLKPALLINSEPGIVTMGYPYKPGNFLFAKKLQLIYAFIFSFLISGIAFWRDKKLDKMIFYGYVAFFPVFIIYTLRVEFWYLPIWNVSIFVLVFSGFYNIKNISDFKFIKNKKFEWVVFSITVFIIILFGLKNFYVINDGSKFGDKYRGKIYVPAYADKGEFDRFNAYKNVALNHVEKNKSILTNEVGVFGFFYRGEIHDLFGLTSSNVIEIYKKNELNNNGQNPLNSISVIQQLKPDYLVGAWVTGLNKKEMKVLHGLKYKLVYTDPVNKVWGEQMQVWKKL